MERCRRRKADSYRLAVYQAKKGWDTVRNVGRTESSKSQGRSGNIALIGLALHSRASSKGGPKAPVHLTHPITERMSGSPVPPPNTVIAGMGRCRCLKRNDVSFSTGSHSGSGGIHARSTAVHGLVARKLMRGSVSSSPIRLITPEISRCFA
jgi:hypothetical protein